MLALCHALGRYRQLGKLNPLDQNGRYINKQGKQFPLQQGKLSSAKCRNNTEKSTYSSPTVFFHPQI